jgi:hypothetical protein
MFPEQIGALAARKLHDRISGESGHGAPDQMDAIRVIQTDSGADDGSAIL